MPASRRSGGIFLATAVASCCFAATVAVIGLSSSGGGGGRQLLEEGTWARRAHLMLGPALPRLRSDHGGLDDFSDYKEVGCLLSSHSRLQQLKVNVEGVGEMATFRASHMLHLGASGTIPTP